LAAMHTGGGSGRSAEAGDGSECSLSMRMRLSCHAVKLCACGLAKAVFSKDMCLYIPFEAKRYRTVISTDFLFTCWLSNYGPCQLDLECNRRTRQTKRVECRWKALAPVRCPEPYVDVRLHTARSCRRYSVGRALTLWSRAHLALHARTPVAAHPSIPGGLLPCPAPFT
jgi:hypothetical protein